ncbi:MAG: NYN domain-containing protein [Actinomycetota bacterium]|nr:NYN domain-containing protein [Actinomycetota bacterium]
MRLPEPTVYLFDGYNLLHAGRFRDREELIHRLASYVAVRGARGIVVFDGVGRDDRYGALEVRFAEPADRLLERLAAEHRHEESVLLVSSDRDLRGTAGQEVRKRASHDFARDLTGDAASKRPTPEQRSQIEDALDPATRERLERWRRRRG